MTTTAMGRRLRAGGAALPLVSTLALRMSQFLVVLIVSRIGLGVWQNFLLAALGTMTAFTILSDSGAANYMLSRTGGILFRNTYATAIGVQFALTTCGALITTAIVWGRAPFGVPAELWWVLGGLCVGQILDSSLRPIRSPLLLAGDDLGYSLPELRLALLKLPVLALAFWDEQLRWLLLLPVLSAVVTAMAARSIYHSLPTGKALKGPLLRNILQYGLAGSLSGLYSQLPLAVAALLLPLSQTAMLTVAYRIVQPLEIFPGTIATQLLPRVKAKVMRPVLWWLVFCALGLAMFLVVMMGASWLVHNGLKVADWDAPVILVVAICLIPKSGNYLLSAVLMGRGGIHSRLFATAAVGTFAAITSFAVATVGGVIALASVSLISESLLCAGLWRSLSRLSAGALTA